MNALDQVQDVADRHGLRLHRAWPRSADHLLLDLVGEGGGAVAGQWLATPEAAARVAARTGGPARSDGPVVLQPDGADRRLHGLRHLLTEPGSTLVAHRPERRAVVRCADGSYAKIVRPERLADLERSARQAGRSGLRVPRVLGTDPLAGMLRTAALPGRTLHDLLGDESVDAAAVGRRVGRAVAALHATPLPVGAAVHDAAAEVAVVRRWSRLADAHGVGFAVPPLPVDETPAPLVRVHRDLHDKQLLLDGSAVGLLDFDLAAAGEAALDLANLLVHLQLRAEQGRWLPDRARAVAEAVLAGYAPERDVLRRLPFYEATTRTRLVAVYGFRPSTRAAARRLVSRVVA